MVFTIAATDAVDFPMIEVEVLRSSLHPGYSTNVKIETLLILFS